MKTSRKWLQNYFEAELPSSEAIADALTFHAVEIEEVAGDLLDVKILPDRAAYMLSHRGVALEIAASLNLVLKEDPFRTPPPDYPSTGKLTVELEGEEKTHRYMGALVEGVKVGPSPSWLKEALESVGQRSINNVVDATNYVMLNIGQPLHAFDAKKLKVKDGGYAITVRGALEGEKITTLSGEEFALPEGVLLIVDRNADAPLGIAGVKGGTAAQIDEGTTDLIIEAANFDGTSVRRTAQALKLFTDASQRFQNKPSPALAAYALRDVLALIHDIAGGTLLGVTDVYPMPVTPETVSVSLAKINALLGSSYGMDEVRTALTRLGFSYTETEDMFTVIPSFERRDLSIPEDLVEEVGRILGYEHIPSTMLPPLGTAPNQYRFRGIERIKDFLTERGYAELSTQSFGVTGDIELANPLQLNRPWMRASLLPNMEAQRAFTATVAPRVLGPASAIKLFEIGNVFTNSGEVLMLALGISTEHKKDAPEILKENVATLEQELFGTPVHAQYSLDGTMIEMDLAKVNLEKLGEDYAPVEISLGAYQPFSIYPAALRDIAVWTPLGTEESEVANLILKEAGDRLVRIDLFDRFEKEERISYAFRLVFESKERTLSDADLDPAMERITAALNAAPGFSVR